MAWKQEAEETIINYWKQFHQKIRHKQEASEMKEEFHKHAREGKKKFLCE